MDKQYDIIIVGTGIAGLSTLLYLTEGEECKNDLLKIAIIAKDALDCTNTNWAQGGIAAVHAMGDNFEKHIQDTLIAGAFSNNKAIVRKVVESAPSLLNDLIRWGTIFDKNANKEIDLAKEGGHSASRIWHYQDQTGYAIENALLLKLMQLAQLDIFEYAQVTQIEPIDNSRFQVQLFNKKSDQFFDLNCSNLVLATGGLGILYDKTTNQKVATGDGIYFAKQLGASLKDISYIQFHPTGLVQEGNIAFLISEALRGAGAVLRNHSGKAFMSEYDERADLAPRDIVSRSILEEMNKNGNSHVYLDATAVDHSFLEAHFPNIKKECLSIALIDIETDYIPIVPVQHYSCGGILVNEYGESTIKNLYAIGELACTGLHGANRLASNSLLEAIAFAKYASMHLLAKQKTKNMETESTPFEKKIATIDVTKSIDIKMVQQTMSQYAGVVRTNKGLSKALALLKTEKNEAVIQKKFDLQLFQNEIMLDVAILLLEDALEKKENKGVHYNLDLV